MLLIVEFFVFVSLLTYCALKWLKYYKVPSNFPPGPPSVPVLGVLPFIRGDFKAAMQAWRELYGEVVGLQLGTDLAVVLSDFDDIATAFKDNRFTGRPRSLQQAMSAFFASGPKERNGGIVFTHGNQWTEQRRFALKTLRDFGFGKKGMEKIISEEITKLCSIIDKRQCKDPEQGDNKTSLALSQLLSISVVNSIWTLITGEKIEHGDTTVNEIVRGTDKFIKNESLSGPIMMLPWLRHLPVIKDKFEETKEAPLKMRRLQDKTVAEHEAFIKQKEGQGSNNNNPLDEPKDFIDVYLRKIRGTSDVTSSFYGDYGRVNLQRSLTDLFGAGSETSSSMLLFCFLYMIRYPEVQLLIHREISRVMKEDGADAVTLDQRARMPYTDAVLHEVMRHACLVYSVPHAATEDAVLPGSGHDVPAGAAVYANVWQVMHNPDYWEDPEVFRPSRFIDPETGRFRRDERCIPFMMGKRFCIGQTLAQDQLFLFFAGLLKKFEFRAPHGPETVSTDPVVGFIHSCPSYDVHISQRA